ncbi:ceramide-1-phosphate transfer protein-like [Dendronephthya gigantea]|uniref:ceramide-1-phosphate transfer protein-like n=1 Tax=Dendronephthya gigantea TaxID=151771 RepID=UPI00106C3ADE|nr:ceramide-1-phosphate transfer protein-like [Dendronephthya gigantea]
MSEVVKFDPKELLDAFKKAKEGEEVVIDEYVRGYVQLTHFFDLLGTVFGYINSDINEKVAILQSYRSQEISEFYRTVKSMMEYEISKDFNVSSEHPSGSRTLLRLHRALAFASLFMKRLSEAGLQDKSSNIAYDSYNETLAQFHPWLIRKGVGVATYTLGSCGSLLEKCGGDLSDVDEAKKILGEISIAMDEVFNLTESLYTHFDLHGLP